MSGHPTLRRVLAACLFAAPLLLAGCRGDETATAPSETAEDAAADLSPAELGAIGASLRADPDRADVILAEHGLEWEAYETAVRAVAADVEDARKYEEALVAGEATGGADAASPAP